MKKSDTMNTPPHINNAKRINESSKSKSSRKSDLQRQLEADILMASQVGDTIWLEQCLTTTTLSLDFTDRDGLSAIHLAALDCQLECLKILVEKMGVDVNHRSPGGWTCLHLTINNSTPERSLACVNYLLSSGADPSSLTDFDITPMHQAAACGNVPCLQSLIDIGGIIDCEDARGHTPCSLATLWGHRESARILKHYQWTKDKKSEDKFKRELRKEEEASARLEEERINKEKKEKRIRGQKAYQLWLSKNSSTDMPLLFGQYPVLDDGNIAGDNARVTTSRQKTGSSRATKSKKNDSPMRGHGRERKASKQIEFMPINGPGSPLAGKRYMTDYDKRSISNLTSGRIKAVQKRGLLQFPVI